MLTIIIIFVVLWFILNGPSESGLCLFRLSA